MTDLTSTPPLVLLPAVDVVDGQAVRLTQGEAGSETSYGDPVAAARTWRDQVRSGSTSSTSTRRSGAVTTGRSSRRRSARSRASRSSSPAGSATTPRSRRRSRPVLRASTSAPRRSRSPSGLRASSASTASRSPSASTSVNHAGEPRLDRGRRGPVGGARPARGRRVRPLRGDRRHEGRHAAGAERRAPARGLRPHRPARGGLGRHLDARGPPSAARAGAARLEGAIIGKALYSGAFTLPAALDIASE